MSKYEIDPSDTSFTQVLNRILFDATLSMGARLTYAALVEHYRDNGSCWPSMARLASMVGVKSARSVQNYMKELTTRGLVTVLKRGCWKRANEYRLNALVPPRTAQEGQPVARTDMRNQAGPDIRNRTYPQPYQPKIRVNNWKRVVGQEAGAIAYARRNNLLQ